jgi:hypothetical protein
LSYYFCPCQILSTHSHTPKPFLIPLLYRPHHRENKSFIALFIWNSYLSLPLFLSVDLYSTTATTPLFPSNSNMANALNPDAPAFISSQHKTVPYGPLELSPFANPNPNLTFSSYPIYFQVQTPHGTSTICAYSSPQSIPYQYWSFPLYCSSTTYQLILPPCSPPAPPTVSTCSIQDLDESTGATTEGEIVETPPSMTRSTVVLNRRRVQARKGERSVMRAPRYPEQRGRAAVKVPHQLYEISEDANSELGGKTTLMIKNLPSKFRQVSLSVCCHF